jgi:hypothetical protein
VFAKLDLIGRRVYLSATLGSFLIEEFTTGLPTFDGTFDKPLLLLERYDCLEKYG